MKIKIDYDYIFTNFLAISALGEFKDGEEVSDEKLKQWKRIQSEFDKMQSEMEAIWKKQR